MSPACRRYPAKTSPTTATWERARLRARQPDTLKRLSELMCEALKPSGLNFRQRGILVTAAARGPGSQPSHRTGRLR